MSPAIDCFVELKKEASTYLSADSLTCIEKAYQMAVQGHQHQKRSSGEPYITHPVAVAKLLVDMHLDQDSIIAALLHDLLEDTATSKEEIAQEFGQQVAELVDGVSKLAQIKFGNRAEAQAENFRKMMLAMVNDIRVILVKLADRLHNMRTLDYLSRERQRRIARETLEIYAPIANRLGMHNFRIEFEELCFQALYPMRYRVLKEVVRNARGNRETIVSDIKKALEKRSKEANIAVVGVWGREKHLYGIYKKMRSKKLQFSEIMDVYAFRILVLTIDDCYRMLGVVHNIYKPLPERFKDYIAIPKANGYQSLHTTLFGPYGVPVEIQIRTEQMDRTAGSGIAAHWRYKSDDDVEEDGNDTQRRAREWVNGLVEMQKNAGNSLEFIENVKIELFPDEVYVFTPKGVILELPRGATAVDFAYAVHSDVGNTCVATKIDRRLAPLSTPLVNGQTVEIITAPGARPNPTWLNFVVTGKARSNIRHFIKAQKQSESVALGQDLLSKALESLASSLDQITDEQKQKLLVHVSLPDWDNLLEAIGLGDQLSMTMARQLLGLAQTDLADPLSFADPTAKPILVRGGSGMLIEFASCCRPIPGDPIVGILQAGQGLMVHTEHCVNLQNSGKKRQAMQLVPVCWEAGISEEFKVDLRVEVINRRGVLAELAVAIAEVEANINDLTVNELDNSYTVIDVTLSVHDRRHLARAMRRIRRCQFVSRVARTKEKLGD